MTTVLEIHNSFYKGNDFFLDEISELRKEYSRLTDKVKSLEMLGFTRTEEIRRKSRLEIILRNYEGIEEVSKYFLSKYPLYKFITQYTVDKLCEKYGLNQNTLNFYTGEVPDKNLQEIINFKIDDNDFCYFYHGYYRSFAEIQNTESYVNVGGSLKELHKKYFKKSELEIVAPSSMMIQPERTSEVLDDPIVLQPVCYKNRKYFLIVTAWGTEASDIDIANPIYN